MAKSDEILVELAKVSEKQKSIANNIADLKIQDEAQTATMSAMRDSIAKIDKRQAVLEVKAGLWGTIGGMISASYLYIKHLLIGS